jgi:tetratricopeptide (TPR) repeat protein
MRHVLIVHGRCFARLWYLQEAAWPIAVLLGLCHGLAYGLVDESAGVLSVGDFITRSQKLNLSLSHSSELDALIKDYEELIGKSGSVAGVEWAMWDLARLYAMNNDSQANPVGDSLEKSIAWYRKAGSIARKETALWRDCRFGLAMELRRTGASKAALGEARRIVEELREECPNDNAVQLQCREQLVQQLLSEKRIPEAEALCREILAIQEFDPPERLQACQMVTINALLQGSFRHSGQAGVQDKWLQTFLDDFPGNRDVQNAVALIKNTRGPITPVHDIAQRKGSLTSMRSFVIFNVTVLIGVLAILAYRRRARRSAS